MCRHPCVISLTSRLFERSVGATSRVPDLLKLLISQIHMVDDQQSVSNVLIEPETFPVRPFL